MNNKNKQTKYTLEEFNFHLKKALEGSLESTERIMYMSTPLIK